MNRDQVHESRYLAGQVRRWHTWPTLRKPTVAEHQCRVAQIYCELWGLPRAEVLYYCLHHDQGEQFAGDVPFGGKHRVEGYGEAVNAAENLGLAAQKITLPELTKTEWHRFKICDMLEMWEFCLHEQRMGNTYMSAPLQDLMRKVREMADELADWRRIDNWIREESLT